MPWKGDEGKNHQNGWPINWHLLTRDRSGANFLTPVGGGNAALYWERRGKSQLFLCLEEDEAGFWRCAAVRNGQWWERIRPLCRVIVNDDWTSRYAVPPELIWEG